MRVAPILFALAALPAAAQTSDPLPQPELDAITARGLALAAYDRAAWIASDSVMALKPRPERATMYVAEPDPITGKWVVSFGMLNAAQDTFWVAYRALEGATPANFAAIDLDPSAAGTPNQAAMARAIVLAKGDFGATPRPYNFAIVAGDSAGWWVYAMPAQTEAGKWPLGGDVRYLVSGDGRRILAKRQLHRTILELGGPPRSGDATLAEDMHTAVIDDRPEDTDVFFTLVRAPHVGHLVVTTRFIYRIAPDGSIRYLGTTAELLAR